jgi:hypothetical protein
MNNPNMNSLLSASAVAASAHLGNGTNNGNQHRSTELPPLNYSDMMRTLAAKYNNCSNE